VTGEEAVAPLPCPWCTQDIDTEEMIWMVRGKFYCSEKCARGAAMKHV
jgi:hypothetical protein